MRQKLLKNARQLISVSPLPAWPARDVGRIGPRRSLNGPSVAPLIGRRLLSALPSLGLSAFAIPLPYRDPPLTFNRGLQSGPIPVMIMEIRLPSSDKGSSMIS